MTVNIGREVNATPRAGIAERGNGQTDAPITTPNTDMDDIAPATFSVGGVDEFDEALTFRGDFRLRRGRSQHAMPSGAVFGDIHRAARQQVLALSFEIACNQQRFGSVVKGAGSVLPAGVQLDTRGIDNGQPGRINAG